MKSPAAGFSFGSDWLAGGGAGNDGCFDAFAGGGAGNNNSFDAFVAALSGGDPGGGGGSSGGSGVDVVSPAFKAVMSSR